MAHNVIPRPVARRSGFDLARQHHASLIEREALKLEFFKALALSLAQLPTKTEIRDVRWGVSGFSFVTNEIHINSEVARRFDQKQFAVACQMVADSCGCRLDFGADGSLSFRKEDGIEDEKPQRPRQSAVRFSLQLHLATLRAWMDGAVRSSAARKAWVLA